MIERMYDTSQLKNHCDCGIVAATAASTYSFLGHQSAVSSAPWTGSTSCRGQMVLVPELQHIDYVADAGGDLPSSVKPLVEQVDAGWEVWAIVPLAQLADAHDVYRDRINFVQGWWRGSSGEIAFTEPEVP